MGLSVFAENYKCYREGDCPWTRKQLEKIDIEELHKIAVDHRMTQTKHHYDKCVTISGILSCYTETAKHQVAAVKRMSQKIMDEMRDCSALAGLSKEG